MDAILPHPCQTNRVLEIIEWVHELVIFNTDQGYQFTSAEFTGILEYHGIAISMHGKGCALDNIFIERFWRTVKHDDIYLKGYVTVPECKAGLAQFFDGYKAEESIHHLKDTILPMYLLERSPSRRRHSLEAN